MYHGNKTKEHQDLGPQNNLVIGGNCYIRALYNEVPLYILLKAHEQKGLF